MYLLAGSGRTSARWASGDAYSYAPSLSLLGRQQPFPCYRMTGRETRKEEEICHTVTVVWAASSVLCLQQGWSLVWSLRACDYMFLAQKAGHGRTQTSRSLSSGRLPFFLFQPSIYLSILIEMSLRMVLRDRLGQYSVGLNVNKKGSDSFRG
jgi:hypothetical protein